jgi:Holliday junction resolvase RusA-like endonuclease
MVKITICGKPVSWKAHQGSGNTSYNPRFFEKADYRILIVNQWGSLPLQGVVFVECAFTFRMPERWSKAKKQAMNGQYHLSRPDGSNCFKFIEDCLKGIVFVDDSQVMGKYDKRWGYVNRTECKINIEEANHAISEG